MCQEVARDAYVPALVILAILFAPYSQTQMLPSGPNATPVGVELDVGTEKSVIAPEVEILPILPVPKHVNHKHASLGAPEVMPHADEPEGSAYSLNAPARVTRPICKPPI